jgi:hypothetical protein
VFGLVLLTIVSLGVIAAGGVVINCAAPYLVVLDDQAAVLCSGLGNLGLVANPLIGVGITLTGVLALTSVWWSAFKRRRRRRRVESTGSLVSNIHRLPETSSEAETLGDQTLEHLEIWERLHVLEKRMRSATSPGRDVASTWLELLRCANDQHSQGQLSTEDFKTMIARLLELVSEESDSIKSTTMV